MECSLDNHPLQIPHRSIPPHYLLIRVVTNNSTTKRMPTAEPSKDDWLLQKTNDGNWCFHPS